jgi:hypothetical protein
MTVSLSEDFIEELRHETFDLVGEMSSERNIYIYIPASNA